MNINATVDVETKTIAISQTIIYKNESNKVLKTIYLNDWNNSYSTKTTLWPNVLKKNSVQNFI